mgnify:CR=1 FL=1
MIYLLPVKNAENVIETTIKKIIEKFGEILIVCIENGSTDNTLIKLNKCNEKYKNVIILQSHIGWGNAVQKGLYYINSMGKRGKLVISAADLPFLFTDIDNSTLDKFDINIGSKYHQKKIGRNRLIRNLYSKFFNTLINKFFSLDIKDTQGTLMINLDTVDLKNIIPHSSGFFASAEILIKANEKYSIDEIPVEDFSSEKNTSTVRIVRDPINIFYEMGKYLIK